jgi:hypothetical protein
MRPVRLSATALMVIAVPAFGILTIPALNGGVHTSTAQAQSKIEELNTQAKSKVEGLNTQAKELIDRLRHGTMPEGIAKSNGRVEATQIDVSAKYPGRLQEVTVDEGDDVTAGQVIARISSPEYEAQLRGAQSQVLQAKQALAEAKAQILPNLALAQAQTTVNRVFITYIPPDNSSFQQLYDLLKERRALEKIQEILSPLRLPEDLIIKTTECGAVNSFYKRENFKPTVTICYELLKHILDSLPNETTGVTSADAAVGQFFQVTLHEVGHATFDIFEVPIFGHEEDAADNFATYIMLQFGREQARRLIGGAAWAWRAYLGDYKRNPVVQTRLAAFASDHGLPQERFYNLLCLAFGANKMEFAEAESYLPPTRSPTCLNEYQTLVRAFHKEISPHIDQEVARRVLDTNWLEALESKPSPHK